MIIAIGLRGHACAAQALNGGLRRARAIQPCVLARAIVALDHDPRALGLAPSLVLRAAAGLWAAEGGIAAARAIRQRFVAGQVRALHEITRALGRAVGIRGGATTVLALH